MLSTSGQRTVAVLGLCKCEQLYYYYDMKYIYVRHCIIKAKSYYTTAVAQFDDFMMICLILNIACVWKQFRFVSTHTSVVPADM